MAELAPTGRRIYRVEGLACWYPEDILSGVVQTYRVRTTVQVNVRAASVAEAIRTAPGWGEVVSQSAEPV